MMQAGRFRRGIFIMVFFIIMGWHAAHAAEAGTARIAQLRIKPEYLEAFMIAVREEMETSLRVEPGVVALYAVADRRDPTKMLFFELYVDDAAYQSHRNTAHFQKYFHTTKDMIADRILLEAHPKVLYDKHDIAAKSEEP